MLEARVFHTVPLLCEDKDLMPEMEYRVEVWIIRDTKRIVHIWPADHPWQRRPPTAQYLGGVGWIEVQVELSQDGVTQVLESSEDSVHPRAEQKR